MWDGSATWPSNRWWSPKWNARLAFQVDGKNGARRASGSVSRGGDLFVSATAGSRCIGLFHQGNVHLTLREFHHVERNRQSPLVAMVGGAIAMAILDLLVWKNILTVDDAQVY